MITKKLVIDVFLIVTAVFLSLTAISGAATKALDVTKGDTKDKSKIKESYTENSQVARTSRQKIIFPYTANGLFLISFSAGLILAMTGIGVKVLISHRYEKQSKSKTAEQAIADGGYQEDIAA